jgi:transposase
MVGAPDRWHDGRQNRSDPMKQRKAYTREFKDEACKLVTAHGKSAADAARDLGVPEQTLNRWLKGRGHRGVVAHDPAMAPAGDDPAVLRVQVRELQAKVARLELERDILKKATAFFAREHL